MNRVGHYVFVLLAGLIIAACSGAPPQIADVEIIRIYIRDPATDNVRHQLGLFVGVSDPDGFDDLARLYLIHDKSELYWALDPTTWQKATVRGSEWVGSYGLALPGSEQAPAGEYRILLEDLSGESAETTEELPPIPAVLPAFPSESDEDGDDDEGLTEVWAFDSQGGLIAAVPLGVMDEAQRKMTPEYYLYRRLRGQPLAMATGPISP